MTKRKRAARPFVPVMPNNCPVLQHTADGVFTGRCLHFVGYENPRRCPLHGDVTTAVEQYVMSGAMADDRALPTPGAAP